MDNAKYTEDVTGGEGENSGEICAYGRVVMMGYLGGNGDKNKYG